MITDSVFCVYDAIILSLLEFFGICFYLLIYFYKFYIFYVISLSFKHMCCDDALYGLLFLFWLFFGPQSTHTRSHRLCSVEFPSLSPSVLFSHFVRLFLFMLFVHCCFYSFSFVPCNVMESYVSSEKQNNGEKKNDFNVHSSNFPSLSCYFFYALFHPFISALFCCFFSFSNSDDLTIHKHTHTHSIETESQEKMSRKMEKCLCCVKMCMRWFFRLCLCIWNNVFKAKLCALILFCMHDIWLTLKLGSKARFQHSHFFYFYSRQIRLPVFGSTSWLCYMDFHSLMRDKQKRKKRRECEKVTRSRSKTFSHDFL